MSRQYDSSLEECLKDLGRRRYEEFTSCMCSEHPTSSTIPEKSSKRQNKEISSLRKELEALKLLYKDKTEDVLQLELMFQRGLNHLSIELENLDDKMRRMHQLEMRLNEKLGFGGSMHGSTCAFPTQLRGRARSPGDFSFSNNEGDETSNFSFGEIDENIEVNFPYRQPDKETIEFEKFLAREESKCLQENFSQENEVMYLPFIYKPRKTGYEATKNIPLLLGEVLAERYKIERIIASSNFSTVIECYDIRLKRQVCLKIIHNEKETFDQGLDEIKVMKELARCAANDLAQQCIVALYEYFYYREHLFIVYELLGENLFNINTQPEVSWILKSQVKSIVSQVLTALDFIHSQGVIHADIKPENILVATPLRKRVHSPTHCSIRLIDFGNSCFTTDELTTYIQSKSYRAPEVVMGGPYDCKIDMWSLGCVVVEILSGDILFSWETIEEFLLKVEKVTQQLPTQGKLLEMYIRDGMLRTQDSPQVSGKTLQEIAGEDQLLLNFLTCLLQVDPGNRLSAREALSHPWLQM